MGFRTPLYDLFDQQGNILRLIIGRYNDEALHIISKISRFKRCILPFLSYVRIIIPETPIYKQARSSAYMRKTSGLKYPGGDLFSRQVAPRVSSARMGFTTVFG